MKRAGDALRQAFMSRDEYECLREEEKVWGRMAKPLALGAAVVLGTAVLIAAIIFMDILFSFTGKRWLSCQRERLEPLPIDVKDVMGDSRASYLLTEEEAAEYFKIVVFLPTAIIFSVAVIYLVSGMAVVYTAPRRHIFLRAVENNCCASKRGGVRCLATLNISFLVVFALLALFLGSSILTIQTECSIPLFGCYEVACWGLVFLFGGTAFFLNRKAAIIMDEGEYFGSRTVGVELLEASPVSPAELERRVSAGFRSWMGSSILSSSDDEDAHEIRGLDDAWDVEHAKPFDLPMALNGARSSRLSDDARP
ncbi:hypothetical protein O6H91_22G059000 [Diphasiastrum complanatum]|uniref:Uncharacterized protein n=1 Tax=Diphasiastrum complanatum TaxID=34168 RepID=A0ACC2AFY3_DIPCM|nr:hypothetical protein O6H91_22G059000 [Diphasiastrum complanatum]